MIFSSKLSEKVGVKLNKTQMFKGDFEGLSTTL